MIRFQREWVPGHDIFVQSLSVRLIKATDEVVAVLKEHAPCLLLDEALEVSVRRAVTGVEQVQDGFDPRVVYAHLGRLLGEEIVSQLWGDGPPD